MSQIGNLGSTIVFEVNSNKVLTFTNFTQSVKGRWNTHEIIGSKPKMEFNGADLRTSSFKVMLSAMHGVKPNNILSSIESAIESGETMSLVIGGRKIGNNSWVITDCSETYDCVYSKGELVKASVTINLKEYV